MNKTMVFITAFIIYVLSTYFSYSYFAANRTEDIKDPLSNDENKQILVDSEEVDQNEPKTEECPLNGELLTKTQKEKWEKRRPLGIMVENHLDARPQSGLTMADIIYEAVAEGGITRFLAVFYCKDSDPVGPTRSARVYFIKLLQQYGDYPLYAHVGGANCNKTTGSGCANGAPADAIGLIGKLSWNLYNDLNQFSVPFPNFWRDYERLPGRATEHTVYTSTRKLWDYAAEKRKLTDVDSEGNKWDESFVTWSFKDDAPEPKRGTLEKISFGFWSNFADQYHVDWIYDKQTNSFKRENGGEPQLDKTTGKQLEAKNVIIAFMQESPANDGYEGGHNLYKTTGAGKAIVFQDGKAQEATWSRDDETSSLKYETPEGEEISIVRGKVFVEILPIGNKVVY